MCRMIFFSLFAFTFAFSESFLNEEQAFWAWDDGLITYDELEDLLALIQDGEDEEACALWESYGGEPCPETVASLLSKSKVHGGLAYSASFDSLGHVSRRRFLTKASWMQFSGNAVFAGEPAMNAKPEKWRIQYKGKREFAVLGNLSKGDAGSLLPIIPVLGYAGGLETKLWEAGALLTADSAIGVRAGFGDVKVLRISAFALGSLEREYSLFLCTRFAGSDLTVAYNRGWRTPLLFASFVNNKKDMLGIRYHFKGYFHGNDSLPGFFRLPRSVNKNKWWWSQWANVPLKQWMIVLAERTTVPKDSGIIHSDFSLSAKKKCRRSALGTVVSARALGDSLLLSFTLASGIRLFESESLFTEIKWNLEKLPVFEWGVKANLGKKAYSQVLLTVNEAFSETSPLILREQTEMLFCKWFSGKLFADFRIRKRSGVSLKRFGVSGKAEF